MSVWSYCLHAGMCVGVCLYPGMSMRVGVVSACVRTHMNMFVLITSYGEAVPCVCHHSDTKQ